VPDLKVRYIRRTRSTDAVVVQEFDCTFHSLPLIAHTLRRIPGTRRSMTGPLWSIRETLWSVAGTLRTVCGTLESMAKTLLSVREILRSMVGILWSIRETPQSRAETVGSVRDVLESMVGTLPSGRPMHRRVAGTLRTFFAEMQGDRAIQKERLGLDSKLPLSFDRTRRESKLSTAPPLRHRAGPAEHPERPPVSDRTAIRRAPGATMEHSARISEQNTIADKMEFCVYPTSRPNHRRPPFCAITRKITQKQQLRIRTGLATRLRRRDKN
jgi:hypothetical protein